MCMQSLFMRPDLNFNNIVTSNRVFIFDDIPRVEVLEMFKSVHITAITRIVQNELGSMLCTFSIKANTLMIKRNLKNLLQFYSFFFNY